MQSGLSKFLRTMAAAFGQLAADLEQRGVGVNRESSRTAPSADSALPPQRAVREYVAEHPGVQVAQLSRAIDPIMRSCAQDRYQAVCQAVSTLIRKGRLRQDEERGLHVE